MKPTEYFYKKSVIRRRLWTRGIFVFGGCVALSFFGLSISHWTDLLIPCTIGLFSSRIVLDLMLLFRRSPAVIIGDKGVRDAYFKDTLIPWAAINEIKATPSAKTSDGGLFLITDASRHPTIPGSVVTRLANWIRAARQGAEYRQSVFPLTHTAALDGTLNDLLEDIRSRKTASTIPIDSLR